jgi:glycosyltransferase involved in cell wall biosynthesis
MTRVLARQRRCIVICLDEAGAWAPTLAESGVSVYALHREPGFQPRLAQRIASLARAHGARILHCHQYSPYVYGRLAALATPGLSAILTEHGRISDTPASQKRRWANRILALRPSPMYAVSHELRRQMISEGFPDSELRVIYNGIDPAPPGAVTKEAARRAIGIPTATPVIGTAGRLDPVKDYGTLIEAFARVREHMPAAMLVLIGDGPQRDSLERMVAARELQAFVRLTGHRDDVRRLLPAFDLYVNSSISEGISVTILEAMAAAVPVLATRVGGTPEIIEADVNGLLVPSRDPGAMAALITTALSSPSLRTRMGDAGRTCVRTRFTLDRMVGDYERAYADALSAA